MKMKSFYVVVVLFIAILSTGLLIYNSAERERKEQAQKELDMLRLKISYDSLQRLK